MAQLLQLTKDGYSIAFLNGAASFVASIPLGLDPTYFHPKHSLARLFPNRPQITAPSSSFLASSGGNALYAALAMCDRVDVYGVGLFSEGGAGGDKLYAHAWDDRIGSCAMPGGGLEVLRMKPGSQSINGMSFTPKWLKGRIENELLMHVFHAFDIIRWIT